MKTALATVLNMSIEQLDSLDVNELSEKLNPGSSRSNDFTLASVIAKQIVLTGRYVLLTACPLPALLYKFRI